MGEERWWSNVDFWRGVSEVAVLYGYHPTFAHDMNIVATSFPRGLCPQNFMNKPSICNHRSAAGGNTLKLSSAARR